MRPTLIPPRRFSGAGVALIALAFLPVLASPLFGRDKEERKELPAEKQLRDNPIVKEKQCITCHTIGNEGGTVGPNLNQVGNRRSADWLRRWLTDPNAVKPGTKMPNFGFSERELTALVEALSRMRRDINVNALLAGGTPVEKGRRLFENYDCAACHRIGREGRFVGPDLTWVGHRKREDWEARWLRDPPAYKPGTFMPKFGFSEPEIAALTAFLHDQQGQANTKSRRWEQTVAYYLDLPAKERGKLVYRRLACWSCHGEDAAGGIRNDNQAPDGVTPSLRKALAVLDDAALERVIRDGSRAGTLDPAAPAPFDCPAYAEAVDESELADLILYLRALAPKKKKWSFQ